MAEVNHLEDLCVYPFLQNISNKTVTSRVSTQSKTFFIKKKKKKKKKNFLNKWVSELRQKKKKIKKKS
jgi:hypothetical protein